MFTGGKIYMVRRTKVHVVQWGFLTIEVCGLSMHLPLEERRLNGAMLFVMHAHFR